MTALYQARVASNIAFLKYWGKREGYLQWPANDSLSMTLSQLCSTTSAQRIEGRDHSFTFDGIKVSRDDKRFAKTFRHLDYLAAAIGAKGALELKSTNNFPTGAGIASSASGLAALTLAAIAAWQETSSWQALEELHYSRAKLADFARIGSGSAGRSLFGGYVQWVAGQNPEAQSIEPLAGPQHWALRDTIVLFSTEEKSIGSTEAHAYAWSSPLFRPRLAGLATRMKAMQKALLERRWSELGPLLETEALEMHAVIMTATPSHNYLNQAALDFLVKLREARDQGLIDAYFTIDAGPNIHLIHEESQHTRLKAWLETLFPPTQLLHDKVGNGPELTQMS